MGGVNPAQGLNIYLASIELGDQGEKENSQIWQTERKEFQNIISALNCFAAVSDGSSSIPPWQKKTKSFQDAFP